ncbi:MAG: hypothetical protein GF331_22815 [Chitinivibrionales bacterium]|nr:hypothetical protein [Chitinivibrionales bacterium]
MQRRWSFCPGGLLSVAVLLVALLVAACDMFSVRDSEPPVDGAHQDVFSFSDILDGTVASFDRLDYSDLFTEGFHYRQGTLPPHNRREFTGRLVDIENDHLSITLEWQRTANPAFSLEDTVELDSTVYRVYINGDRSDAPDYSGHADIGLVHVGYWAICYWYDFPGVTDSTGRSFFNPHFEPN